MRIHPLTKAMTLAFCSAGLVACGGDDDDSSDGGGGADTTAEVRVVHASSDAPNVNAGLNGGGQVSDLAYGNATGFLEVSEDDYDVSVDGILPDGSTTNVISASGVTLSASNETSIFAVGNVGSIEPLVVTADDADPSSGDVRAQVVHASAAASSAGKLDVYVTGPGASLTDNSVDPLGTFEFKGDIGPATVPGGDYRIRVTPEGTPGTVVFDSGTVPLSGGSDLTIAAIDDTGPSSNTSPIRLLVAPEGDDSFVLRDQSSNTELRAAHLSTNAPDPVDIEVGGSVPGPLDDFGFGNLSGYLNIASGDYDVNVLQSDGSSTGVGVSGLTLKPQSFNTAYAINDGNGSAELIRTEDDLRSVATEVRFRVVHGSQNATAAAAQGRVDVYALPDGTAPDEVGADAAAIESLAFRDNAEAAADASAGPFDLYVTPEDTPSNTVIGPVNVDPSNGEVYTVIARDNGSGGFAAILQNDTQ